jgi:hypothetical protein
MANFGNILSQNVMPAKVDTFKILGYTPTERQAVFHEASMAEAEIFGILYGGAAGGGKSCAFLMDAIYNAVNYPKMRIGCVRRTYPELEESFIAPLLAKWGGAKALGGRWNGTKKMLSFPNGSVINFVYAETVQDVTNIQGGEYQAFYIDEGALMPPAVIQQIQERLRSADKLIPVVGMRIASNPGGSAHKYLKDRFINPTKKGKLKTAKEPIGKTGRFRKVAFIEAKVDDNPHLNEDYTDVLDSIEDPQRRKAMRDGDWDAMVGQFFMQWSSKRHCVQSFDISPEWQRYAGIDYGTLDPFACVWVAPDPDGRMWVYREISATGLQARDQARYILDAEKSAKESSVIRVADPSMWGNNGTPLSIADSYGLEGCGIYKADHDRQSGWSLCHQYLNEGPACPLHASKGWKTCPMLHVFEDKCPMFVEQIPALTRNPLKPEDAATLNVEDHIADAWRYVCMAVGTFARPVFYDTPSTGDTSTAEEIEEDQPIRPAKTYDQLFGGNWDSPFKERY